MRMFGWYGAPDGSIPWVFLGDFVDRTPYGCEVLLLLYALKIKWPQKIVLLRGNHEIASINEYYGFKEELTSKWGITRGEMLFHQFNDSFTYLPLAAVAAPPGYEGEPDEDADRNQRFIPNRYLLVHGGIGRLETLAQISALRRPIRGGGYTAEDRTLTELVWSDPTADDNLNGYTLNKRDNYSGTIVCYGADRVAAFCERNHITAILRGHEVIQEGLELAFGGRVVTFFSAVNYGGHGSNHGCILNLALTTDEDCMPTIEVQPIRLEAKPQVARPSLSLPYEDDGDVTDAEPDLNSPEPLENPELLSAAGDRGRQGQEHDARAEGARQRSEEYELEHALEGCPGLAAAYGCSTRRRTLDTVETGPPLRGRSLSSAMQAAYGCHVEPFGAAAATGNGSGTTAQGAAGQGASSGEASGASGGMVTLQLPLEALNALRLGPSEHAAAQGPGTIPFSPTSEWLVQALVQVLHSRSLAAQIAGPASSPSAPAAIVSPSGGVAAPDAAPPPVAQPSTPQHVQVADAAPVHVSYCPPVAVPEPPPAEQGGGSVGGFGSPTPAEQEASLASGGTFGSPTSPEQAPERSGGGGRRRFGSPTLEEEAGGFVGSGAFGSPTELDGDEDGDAPRGTSLEVLLQAIAAEGDHMDMEECEMEPLGVEGAAEHGGSAGMEVDDEGDDGDIRTPTPVNSPQPHHMAERRRPMGPPPGFGFAAWSQPSSGEGGGAISPGSGGGSGCGDYTATEDCGDEPDDKDQSAECLQDQQQGKPQDKLHPKTKKSVGKYDLPTPPRPSRDAGVFAEMA